MVGDPSPARAIRTAIRRGGISCDLLPEPDDVRKVIGDGGAEAFVFALPLSGVSVPRLRKLVPHDVPLLVAAEKSDAPLLRKLYKAGVTAVFDWPLEKRALVDSLVRIVEVDPLGPERARRPADVTLEEKAKLALETCDGELGVVVVHGRATVFGFVDALWKVYEAEQAVEHIPRIRGVDMTGVNVVGSKRTDASIRKAVRTLLAETSDVDGSTVAIVVEDGHVTLSGSAQSRRELRRLEALVRHVRGVRGVEKLIVVSEDAKRQDRSVAASVQRAMASRGVEDKVDVAVFGGVCVLTGKAATAGQKRTLGELAQLEPGVRRIVNKITT